MPKRIYTDNEFIAVETDKEGEFAKISDVKKVVDHGEFYELIFPLGKVGKKYICQKNLLTKGTLEEFESLFEGKIERKTKE